MEIGRLSNRVQNENNTFDFYSRRHSGESGLSN